MEKLINDLFEVELNCKGAEIISIVDKKDNLNYMWKRDPKYWASSAPILFPIVGGLKNGQCIIEGETYSMKNHGFSRHTEYDIEVVSNTEVKYILHSNEEILKEYPYLFELTVTYILEDNRLKCICHVENKDNRTIYFQIGGHPAFACPLYENESSNDYYIEFEENEYLERKIVDIVNKGLSHNKEPLFENEKRFFVRQAMFDRDAVIVENMKSKSVSLKSLNHDKYVKFYMNNFNHLGIWASGHVGGLIAIEPWVGHGDYIDFEGKFEEKVGIVELKENESFECDFVIEIHN